eukprot:g4167.t1
MIAVRVYVQVITSIANVQIEDNAIGKMEIASVTQGDDPLTTETYDGSGVEQQNEKQIIVLHAIYPFHLSLHGDFTLTYTDEYGGSWTTRPIPLDEDTDYSQQVENALESLPNSVVPDVTVTKADESNCPGILTALSSIIPVTATAVVANSMIMVTDATGVTNLLGNFQIGDKVIFLNSLDTADLNEELTVTAVTKFLLGLEKSGGGQLTNVPGAFSASDMRVKLTKSHKTAAYCVEFNSPANSGDVRNLQVNTLGCPLDGCQPLYRGIQHKFSTTWKHNNAGSYASNNGIYFRGDPESKTTGAVTLNSPKKVSYDATHRTIHFNDILNPTTGCPIIGAKVAVASGTNTYVFNVVDTLAVCEWYIVDRDLSLPASLNSGSVTVTFQNPANSIAEIQAPVTLGSKYIFFSRFLKMTELTHFFLKLTPPLAMLGGITALSADVSLTIASGVLTFTDGASSGIDLTQWVVPGDTIKSDVASLIHADDRTSMASGMVFCVNKVTTLTVLVTSCTTGQALKNVAQDTSTTLPTELFIKSTINRPFGKQELMGLSSATVPTFHGLTVGDSIQFSGTTHNNRLFRVKQGSRDGSAILTEDYVRNEHVNSDITFTRFSQTQPAFSYQVAGVGTFTVDLFAGHSVEETKGTKESEVCGGRGLCDSSQGVCNCFNGFTGESCSMQTRGM